MKKAQNNILKIAVIIAMITAGVIAAIDFEKMHEVEELFPSENLSKVGKLSDYNENLKGSNGDSDVYFYDSGKPGATVFLGGGTHPNEAAGYMAAVVILENLNIESGKAIIIPRMNRSAFTCTDPMEGLPTSFDLDTKSGVRTFRSGSRGTNPLDQWPDPLVYSQYPSGQQYSGLDSRNLNRCFPGKKNGTLTEKVAYAVLQILINEKVDIAFDLHEAAPEIPIIKAIVYHSKSEDIAMGAILELEMEELSFTPELSPENFHGLSHREWGDNTNALPFLMETSNPIQGRLRGKTTTQMILDGKSPNYKKAKDTGALKIIYDDDAESLEKRVGRHLAAFTAIINAYNFEYPDKAITITGLPTYSEIIENKIGKYLN